MRLVPFLCLAVFSAQSVMPQLASPLAIPKGPNPPVVFLNGYQAICPGFFKGTFGLADTILAAANISAVFFDNCVVTTSSGKPTIEGAAAGFATFLAALRYADGTPVPQVDIIAHSMGGLIVRAYLAGKRDVTPARFTPPVTTGLRKAVFLGTPHFGSFLASFSGLPGSVFGSDAQSREVQTGSQFLLDLATWNGGVDDMRGLDAIAIAGNNGNGLVTGAANFDDGVVSLTSASLGFLRPGRTRVVPACHVVETVLNLICPPASFGGIANITVASSPVAQIITSFLSGTNAWQSIGVAVESVASVAGNGGLLLGFQDSTGAPVSASSATATTAGGAVALTAGSAAFYRELLPAKTDLPISAKVGADTRTLTVNLPAGASAAIISKPGPVLRGVVSAGSAVFPYAVTSGAYVAIYGTGLAAGTAIAPLPYPTSLGGVTVTINGQPAAIQFVSPRQINLIFPDLGPGSATLTVTNAAGSATTTVVIAAAVPSIFSLDGSGSGPAAAINAITGTIVGASAALKSGTDIVAIFLTGLGPTATRNGLDYAQADVSLTIGGQPCPQSYAGRVPGIPGLDQVNCQIPAGLSGPSVPVVVTVAGRPSNTVTLAIQ